MYNAFTGVFRKINCIFIKRCCLFTQDKYLIRHPLIRISIGAYENIIFIFVNTLHCTWPYTADHVIMPWHTYKQNKIRCWTNQLTKGEGWASSGGSKPPTPRMDCPTCVLPPAAKASFPVHSFRKQRKIRKKGETLLRLPPMAAPDSPLPPSACSCAGLPRSQRRRLSYNSFPSCSSGLEWWMVYSIAACRW